MELRRLSRSAAWLRSEAAWPYALVTVAVAIAFFGTLVGSDHLPYDAELYHFPLLRSVQDALAAGQLPGWNPYTYGGTPLLANAQSAWLYPPHLLLGGALALLGRPLTPGALDVLAVLHVWVAAVATVLLATRRGMGAPAAAFAGGFVTLCGATVAQSQHIGMTETLAWLPLALLAVDRLAEAVTARRVVALGACFALMLTPGFLPLVPWCAAVVVGAAVIRFEGRARATLGAVAGLALGSAFAAAAVLPTLALLDVNPPLEPHPVLPVSSLVTAVIPNAFGHWQDSITAFTFTGTGLTNSYNYVGAAAILLLPLALTSGRRVVPDAVLALLLLLGTFGTTGKWLYDLATGLPSIGKLHRPEDVGYVAALPLGLMLAHGLSRVPRARQLAVAAAFLVALSLVALPDGRGHALHLLTDAPRRQLLALAVLIALVAVAAVATRRGRPARLPALALAAFAVVGVLELASTVPHRYFVNAPGPAIASGRDGPPQDAGVLAALRAKLAPGERVAADVSKLPGEWIGFPPLWGLADVNGFHPQVSKYQLDRVHGLLTDPGVSSRTFSITPAVQPYLDELDVRYVVVSAAVDPFAGAAGYTPVLQTPAEHVYATRLDHERAYAVDPACLRRRGQASPTRCRRPLRVHVSLTGRASRLLRTQPASGATLVMTGDPWYPGWHAEAAGRAVPVERVGYLAAVRLPPGTRAVEVRYRPPGLVAGAAITLVALLGAALALARGARPRRRVTPA